MKISAVALEANFVSFEFIRTSEIINYLLAVLGAPASSGRGRPSWTHIVPFRRKQTSAGRRDCRAPALEVNSREKDVKNKYPSARRRRRDATEDPSQQPDRPSVTSCQTGAPSRGVGGVCMQRADQAGAPVVC